MLIEKIDFRKREVLFIILESLDICIDRDWLINNGPRSHPFIGYDGKQMVRCAINYEARKVSYEELLNILKTQLNEHDTAATEHKLDN